MIRTLMQGFSDEERAEAVSKMKKIGFLKKQIELMSAPAEKRILSVLNCIISEQLMCLPILLETDKEIANITIETKALIGSGATDSFIDKYFVEQHGIPTASLDKSFVLQNADGTPNKIRDITWYTWLKTNHGIVKQFLVTGLGKDHCIFRMSWLKKIILVVDWEKRDNLSK